MLVLEMQTSRSNSSCLLVAYILLKKTHKLAKIEIKISQRYFMSMHRTLWELRRVATQLNCPPGLQGPGMGCVVDDERLCWGEIGGKAMG